MYGLLRFGMVKLLVRGTAERNIVVVIVVVIVNPMLGLGRGILPFDMEGYTRLFAIGRTCTAAVGAKGPFIPKRVITSFSC